MPDQPEVMFDLEATFKAILEQPDVVIPAEEINPDGDFTVEQRAMLQKALEMRLPTPEEIEERTRIAAHNAEIQRRREEKQDKKRGRREALGKTKRRRSR